MSIKEIKNIKKLQEMLKDEMELRKYTYECCIKAGEELAKNSFAWDGKEKNLVVQAMALNKKYEQAEQKLKRITNILFTGKCSNCEGYSPNCSNKELCNFKHNIKNIIDEVE